MRLDTPYFVIIGAQKAGTTSVYHYLREHPEVFMSPVKEPRFFSHLAKVEAGVDTSEDKAVKTLDAYQALFARATAKVVGEASVAYLDVPGTAPLMKQYIPDAKLMVLLRNPADRAYSQYLMRLRKGTTRASFEETVSQGRCLRGGFYYHNLLPFYEHFGAAQMGVYLYDDLCNAPAALMQQICRFLDIDDTFVPDFSVRHNVGGEPRNRWMTRLFSMPRFNALIKQAAPSGLVRLGRTFRQLNYGRVPMPEHVRKQLLAIYEEDILALKKLIDRDVSHWLAYDEAVTN